MTAQDLKEQGFRVSGLVSEAEVTRAAGDVMDAYIMKVYDEFDRPTNHIREAWMQLTVILLLQRHAVATRSGGKTKLTPSQSENAYPTHQDFENADRLLRRIQAEEANNGARQGNLSEIVDDICGIYYRKNFLAL